MHLPRENLESLPRALTCSASYPNTGLSSQDMTASFICRIVWLSFLIHVYLLGRKSVECINSKTANSARNALRHAILDKYDRVIGPVRYGSFSPLKVKFTLKISKLIKVDTKKQMITLKAWVFQKWRDPFLKWKKKDYNNVKKTRFRPNEIWIPDIALYNNGDSTMRLAGGEEMFLTDMVVKSSGWVRWLAPATFTSTCILRVRFWPIDHQVCNLTFGSWTYEEEDLRVFSFYSDNKTLPVGHVSNGEWNVTSITYSKGFHDHNKCCGANFSTVTFTIRMNRKPAFLLFYLCPPAVVLALLTLASFFIPSESGERIGFVTTILLALMVFLLLIPEYLPETSDELPILGILLIVTMIIITIVLICTIFVLRYFHRQGTPSLYYQKFFFPGFFAKKFRKNWVDPIKPVMSPKSPTSDTTEMTDLENSTTDMKDLENSTKDPEIDYDRRCGESDHFSWQDISVRLDQLMFVAILSGSVFICLMIYLFR